MVRSLLLMIPLLLFASGEDGAEAGRRGNALYEQGRYGEAAAAYRSGLQGAATTEAQDRTVAARLHNNLGAALHRQERYRQARDAFRQALETATRDADRVRALYNAGNNAAAEGKLQAALGFYRQALLRDPAYDRARYNYEFLKRKLQERQQQRTDEQRAPEPSDYARRLKRQAETMVQRRQYEAAHTLMQEGLQQDSTVAAYRGFMQRIGEVSRINRGGSSP